MSVFAIIPWSEEFANDMMFDTESAVNRDYLLEPYHEMKTEFESLGHEIHTIDHYVDYSQIDYFLFFSLEWEYYREIIKESKGDRMVYCTAEPPSVHRYNCPAGYRILKHIFPYIMSWNNDWIDGISVFKRNIPYWFVDQREGNLPYSEKKLLTCISGNKHSCYPGELYSERIKAIDFFEKYHPEEFDLYGTGWDLERHCCYMGRTDNKAEAYHKYRFAICYENIEGLKGYVTEKLLDCLASGIVPIYAGSLDVSDYVPNNCFINLRDYDSYCSLYNYISSMDEEHYKEYLKKADDFLRSSKVDYFSGKEYARLILEAVSNEKPGFRSSKLAYKYFKYRYLLFV